VVEGNRGGWWVGELTEISRWSQRSADHRNQKNAAHPEGGARADLQFGSPESLLLAVIGVANPSAKTPTLAERRYNSRAGVPRQ
jgi:hypothetical protein